MARRPSPELVERRRESVPRITYPEQLPISERRQEISDAIRDHQVVIVAGENEVEDATLVEPEVDLALGMSDGDDDVGNRDVCGGPAERIATTRSARAPTGLSSSDGTPPRMVRGHSSVTSHLLC